MAEKSSTTRSSLTGSVFERRGGYSPTGAPVAKLPKVPAGPAPGSRPKTSATDTSSTKGK